MSGDAGLGGQSGQAIIQNILDRLDHLEEITNGIDLMTAEALLQRTNYLKSELDKLKDLQPR